jgi:NAD(P)-dependent dehydrogenase (short-subunit alcohol dehydrogenase family)
MVAKGTGSIVNVSTMAARIGMPGLSVYSATKAALESLTRTWAAEFSPAGVRVNAVAPGPTHTEMALKTVGEEGAEQFAKTTVLGRLATPREIAEVILFLTTDRSAYLTGATIAADAGRTAAQNSIAAPEGVRTGRRRLPERLSREPCGAGCVLPHRTHSLNCPVPRH